MKTANSVMREIWINASRAGGVEFPEVTIGTDFLLQLLLELEFDQYGNGYDDGYKHRSLVAKDELPIDREFKDSKVSFNSGRLFKK